MPYSQGWNRNLKPPRSITIHDYPVYVCVCVCLNYIHKHTSVLQIPKNHSHLQREQLVCSVGFLCAERDGTLYSRVYKDHNSNYTFESILYLNNTFAIIWKTWIHMHKHGMPLGQAPRHDLWVGWTTYRRPPIYKAPAARCPTQDVPQMTCSPTPSSARDWAKTLQKDKHTHREPQTHTHTHSLAQVVSYIPPSIS